MVEIKNVKITVSETCSSVRFETRQENIQPLLPIACENNQDTDSFSVTQFAEKAGITPQAVRKMISERRLNAKKLGEQYMISFEELNRYLQKR